MLSDVQAAVDGRPSGTTLLLLCDFDGTLVAFSADPGAPVLPADRRALLADLTLQPDTAVGIVSGRRLDDLRHRTGLPPSVYHAGLHGLEVAVGDRAWSHPDLAAASGLVRGLVSALESLFTGFPGVVVEDKGPSVAVHARPLDVERRATAFARADALAAAWIADGRVRRLEGDAVVEYVPNLAGHKGDALRWIEEDVVARFARPAWTVYVGDDVTDEDAFRAIESGIAVLVGLRPTAATHKLNGVADVIRFLSWLHARGKV
jgi:trehalose-phosphatase